MPRRFHVPCGHCFARRVPGGTLRDAWGICLHIVRDDGRGGDGRWEREVQDGKAVLRVLRLISLATRWVIPSEVTFLRIAFVLLFDSF